MNKFIRIEWVPFDRLLSSWMLRHPWAKTLFKTMKDRGPYRLLSMEMWWQVRQWAWRHGDVPSVDKVGCYQKCAPGCFGGYLFMIIPIDHFQASLHSSATQLTDIFPWILYTTLYNNPSYSRILIGSCLWSIRGQKNDWRHHYKVFPFAVFKWRKVWRIWIIFYVTGQKKRYKKSCRGIQQVREARRGKIKQFLFRKWSRNTFRAVSVGSRKRLNYAQNWSL